MRHHALAHCQRLRAVHVFLQRLDARRRRVRRRPADDLENPRSALHRRGAVSVGSTHQEGALAEQSPTFRIRERHAPELFAPDVRNAVVNGKALVREGVVRIQQGDHALIGAEHTVDEHLDLFAKCAAQLAVELRVDARVGLDRIHVIDIEPLVGKVGDQRFRARIGEQPLDLGVEHRRVAELARHRGLQQLIVRSLAPQEERQARGQLHIADAVGRSGRRVDRNGLDAIQEFRAGEDRHGGLLDAAVEVLHFAALLVEAHRSGKIVLRYRPAICLACDVGHDLLRARRLFRRIRRMADEDLRAARRVADAARIVGSGHLEAEHARNPRQTAGAQRLQRVVGFRVRARHEGKGDLVRSGRHLQVDVLEALADLLRGIRLLLIHVLQVRLAANIGLIDLLAVEEHQQMLLGIQASDITAAKARARVDVERVVAVRGKQMFGNHAAACTQRQTFQVLFLIAAGRPERDDGFGRVPVTDGQDGDVVRG